MKSAEELSTDTVEETKVDCNKSTANPAVIMIVDDDPSFRSIVGESLSMDGYTVELAADGEAAMRRLHANKDISLVLSDVEMHPMSGAQLLDQCTETFPDVAVVLMSGYGTIENAVDALHHGAADYLVKPFEHADLLKLVKRFIKDNTESSQRLIAVDERSMQLVTVAKRVAASDVTVMISGESGVGKEVVSQFIHDNSSRADGPFVAINCAAIPENMLEAVLFGYEKGAYTGAYQSKAGKFEQAQHGTLLLDEITEMDLGLQAKLLRVLQEREVERLGGNQVIALDVRIIATTNRDIRQSVAEGAFREDLFYRLNVFPLHILPLAERPQDILPIANKMLAAYVKNEEGVHFSIAAQRVLNSYEWPGNIRELDNVVQRCLILKSGKTINADDVQFEESHTTTSVAPSVVFEERSDIENAGLNNDLKAREQDLILSALNARTSRKEVAEKLGISPRTLRYKLAKMRDAGVAIPA